MALEPDFYDYREDFVPNEPFPLRFVGRSLGDDLSLVYPADGYAAARGWWTMNPGPQEDAAGYLVLARSRDRVLGAYRVKSWIQSPSDDGRWGFVGEPADMEAQLKYVERQVPREFRTPRNPVRFAGENESPSQIVYGPAGE